MHLGLEARARASHRGRIQAGHPTHCNHSSSGVTPKTRPGPIPLPDRDRDVLPRRPNRKSRAIAARQRRRRLKLIIKRRPERLRKSAHRKTRAVVLLRDVHRNNLLRPVGHEGGHRLGCLCIGEMAPRREDPILQHAGVGPSAEHRDVMVAFEREDPRVGEQPRGVGPWGGSVPVSVA